ncbi:MAG: glycosyltransferase, partial [Bacteroidales bacterium]|nr:glycosyltransferase [Bacteroidales bacterium]
RICDEYANADKRFRVVHQPNQGVASARNRGLDLAAGDYIYFADGDDELRPEALKHLYDIIKQGEYDVASSGFTHFVDGEMIDKCMVTGSAPVVYSGDDMLVQLLQEGEFTCFTCWNKLISRQLVSGLRFRDIAQEDFLFCGQLYLRLRSLIFLNESLYIYNDHPSSLSKDYSYIGPHQAVIVLSHLLEDAPADRKEARGILLSKLFRRLLTSSYLIAELPLPQSEKIASSEICGAMFKRYQREYFSNSSIPYKEKIKVVAAKMFPRLFVRYIDFLARQ